MGTYWFGCRGARASLNVQTRQNLTLVLPPAPAGYRRLLRTALPDGVGSDCWDCDGRGRVHKCPTCECSCPTCRGTGRHERNSYVEMGQSFLSARLARLLVGLPGPVEIANPLPQWRVPVWFRFAGGDGLVMRLDCDTCWPPLGVAL